MSGILQQSSTQKQASDKRFLQGEAKTPYMLWLAGAYTGSNAVEVLSAVIVPISARLFTDNAVVLAFIISLNALFGFLAAPYVAWKSDRIQTRLGRRRPFMILGYAVMLLSVVGLMAMVQFITGDARHTIWALALLIVLNVLMQCFQDVTQGAMGYLMGDTFSQEKLGRALAFRNYFTMASGFSLSYWAIKKADDLPWLPYLVVCLWLLISMAIVIFKVRERPMHEVAPHTRMYNPLKHLGMLFRNMDYLRVAVIAALALVLPASFGLFNSLYVTQQLGFTMADLAKPNLFTPFVVLALAFPIGYMIDRFGAKYSIALGFAVITAVSGLMAFYVRSVLALIVVMNIFALIPLLIYSAMTPMTFQYAAPDERGAVYGLVQFTRAFTRFLTTLLLGFAVQLSVSWEPTPFYAGDLKKAGDFAARLEASADPVSTYIRGRMSPEALELIKDPVDAKGVKPEVIDSLVIGLNSIITGPSIHDPKVFEGVELSRQSRKLLAKPEKTPQDLLILNRSLITDAYDGIISKNLNYRATYMANIILGLLALVLVLTARPGKYARKMHEAPSQ